MIQYPSSCDITGVYNGRMHYFLHDIMLHFLFWHDAAIPFPSMTQYSHSWHDTVLSFTSMLRYSHSLFEEVLVCLDSCMLICLPKPPNFCSKKKDRVKKKYSHYYLAWRNTFTLHMMQYSHSLAWHNTPTLHMMQYFHSLAWRNTLTVLSL